MLGVQPEPDQRDIRTLPRRNRADLLHIDLAGDHFMPKPGHHLRKQLQPIALFVRDQNAEVPVLVLRHRR